MQSLGLLLLFVFAILVGAPPRAMADTRVQCQSLFEDSTTPAAVSKKLREHLELLRQGEHFVRAKGEAYKITGELKPRSLNLVIDDPNSIVAEIDFTARLYGARPDPLDPPVGSNTFAYFSATRRLEITRTFIDAGFEKQGLTTASVGAALEMFPETEVITGRLIRDNATTFVAAYSKSMASTHEAKMVEAFRATPFFKTVRVYGFSEIDVQASFYRPEKKEENSRLFIKLRRHER